MRDKIIDYYKILLDVGFMKADDDGFVSVLHGDEYRPATIGGKRLILPTREQMKNTNWDNRVGFHPIRESYNLGVSDLIGSLRDLYVERINLSISYLMKELIALAFDQKNQKNLTTEQAQVLNSLAKCDENTVKNFTSLLKNTKSRNDASQFINIFIRRGGEVRGQAFGRAGIVTFPIYTALTETKEPINGVKLSIKDREMFIALYEFIFPTIADKESFNVGVNNRGAPYLESLVRATFNVIDDLVSAAQPYMDLLPVPELLRFPEDMGMWKEIFDSKDMVNRLSQVIPALNSNEDGVNPDEPKTPKQDKHRIDTKSEDLRRLNEDVQATVKEMEQKPRGRMIMGAAAPVSGDSLGKAKPDHSYAANGDRAVIGSSREVRRSDDIDRQDAVRREQEDRERRAREREDEEARRRDRDDRRKEDEEYERKLRALEREHGRDRGRDRDSRDSRDSRDDRSRDRDSRDRNDRDRDSRDTRRSGDVFDDNPVLRELMRDEERGSRYRNDDRDRDRGRGRRDIRDRGYDDREDRYSRDRDRGRR